MNRAAVQSASSALAARLGNRTRGSSSVLIIVCIAAASFVLGTYMAQDNSNPATSGVKSVFGSSEVTASSSAIDVESVPSKKHQILVFGDSLTSGVSGNQLFPYSKYLERALEKEGVQVHMKTQGLPGWTTAGMVKGLDGDKGGLRTAIKSFHGTLSLVLLLAGSNDLKRPKATADEITHNLLQLHTVICKESGVPQSLAIGIPSSAWQVKNEKFGTMIATVNDNLRLSLGSDEYPNTTFVDFPFQYEQNGEYWHEDGLHFSEQGYRLLGESLAPTVAQILEALDTDTDDRQ